MGEFASFAALGDSFTEGVGDPSRDGTGCRGWADRFAGHLATRQPGLRYANLDPKLPARPMSRCRGDRDEPGPGHRPPEATTALAPHQPDDLP